MKYTYFFLAFLIVFGISDARGQSWQQTNGPSGSTIKAVVTNSQGYIFVLSNTLMRSTDDGISWMQIATTFKKYTLLGLQITSSDALFATVTLHPDSGIWRSLDNGDTWQRVLSVGFLKPHISITPNGSIFVLETASLGSSYFLSTDNGNSWAKVISSLNSIAGIWGDKAGQLFISAQGSFYRSTDSGQNWSKIINGITGPFTYFSESPNGYLFGIQSDVCYRSLDSGRTWKHLINFYNVSSININKNGRMIITGDEKTIASDDGGDHWRDVVRSPIFPNGNIHIVGVGSKGDFFGSASNILFRSSLDTNSSLLKIDVPTGSVTSILKHPNGNLIGFTQDNPQGIYKFNIGSIWLSQDDGKYWTMVRSDSVISMQPYANSAIFKTAIDSSHNLLAATEGQIIRSSNSGLNWIRDGARLTSWISGIDVRNSGEIFVSSGTEGIFRSIDNGKTWDQLNNGVKNQQIFSLAIHQNGDVYAGSQDTIYKSTDVGLTWHYLNTNFPSNAGSVTAMVVNTQGDILAAIQNIGVYWSTDNGATWWKRAAGLNATRVNVLLSTPAGKVFAATDSGIFYLDTNAGSNWVKFNDGLTATNIFSLCRDQSGRLFAGSDVSGVFSSIQTFNVANQNGVSQTNISASATSLGTNYPNPFSTSTTIPFSIGERSNITVEVFDALGRSYGVLANGSYEAGSYDTKFNAENLSSGIYFIRLHTEKQNITKAIEIAR